MVATGFQRSKTIAKINETVWYSLTCLASFSLFLLTWVYFVTLFTTSNFFICTRMQKSIINLFIEMRYTLLQFINCSQIVYTLLGCKLMAEFTVISLIIRVLVSTMRVTFMRSFNKACVTSSDPCNPGKCGHAEIKSV